MRHNHDRPLNFVLRCRPLLKRKIWGGRDLERLLGKALPPDELVGESWEVADVPEGTSEIEGGPLDGLSLRDVMREFGDQILPGAFGAQFPLLVKFLDAKDDISIQVHPDADVCRRLYPAERSKNETWLIVAVEPGGAVLHGVREGVGLDEIRARVSEGSIIEAMRRIAVRPGDVIHLPAGTLHALLRGVVLLEIQEPSDSTFRVHDHGRVGQDGQPRELHVEQALASLHLQKDTAARIVPARERHDWGERELLIDIAPYRMERLTLTGEMCWRGAADAPSVVVVTDGEVVADGPGGEMMFRTGETFIVPPAVDRMRLAPIVGRSELVVCLARPGQSRGRGRHPDETTG